MKQFTGIDHPAIAVSDLDESADWYAVTLGYEKFFKEDEKSVWILKAPDGTFLEMMQQDDSNRPERNVLTSGFSHLALRVSNLDEAIAELDEKGVKWISDVFGAIGGGKLRNFEDPDGNMLQIVER